MKVFIVKVTYTIELFYCDSVNIKDKLSLKIIFYIIQVNDF